jgi:cell division protein FtsL|tara:strand:+ start:71 stop:403 length:333 start_codon:yes stop_codon:yes gene_type:complete
MKKNTKRNARKQKEFIQTLSFFGITIASIVGLISYLWVYTEIDETLIAIELQKATREELNNSIKDLQNDIALLGRVDRVTDKAKKELGMVFATPETISVYIDPNNLAFNK